MLVVDATHEHVEQFLRKPIRQDDLDEWFAATKGRPVSVTLREHLVFDPSTYVRALLNDANECICLWGVVAGSHGEGIVWLIASQEAEQHGKHIHRYWPREVGNMHMRFDVLAALAYSGNTLHLEWLKAIGFTEVARDDIGPSRLTFITFIRTIADVRSDHPRHH